MTTLEKELTFETLNNNLDQFYGTEPYYRISPFSDLVMTDGIKYFADTCSCHWLFSDFIALLLRRVTRANDFHFSVVTIEVTKTHMVKMSAKQDTYEPIFWKKQQKDYMACIPIGTYEFYLIDNVILLKSEY